MSGFARRFAEKLGFSERLSEISLCGYAAGKPQNLKFQIEIVFAGADAKTMMKLYDALDDNDDVQKVYANFDIDESEME